VDAPGEEDRVGVTVICGLRQRRSRRSHCGGEKASANAAQNVTTAVKAPHDMHEAFIAGITHRQSLSNQTTAVRGSKQCRIPELMSGHCINEALSTIQL
jgi:hypothetical protein